MKRGDLYVRAAPWFYTAALFAVWEAAVRLFGIPAFLLPPPSAVAGAFVDYWPPIYRNSLFTLSTTLIGFGLAVGFGLEQIPVDFTRSLRA
jgi:NitT/TauT family transport system permease protein